MTERTIARRYVRALFELALEKGDVGAVIHDLERLSSRLVKEPASLGLLFDPRAGKPAKKALVEKLLADATLPLTRDFAAFLVDRGRERILPIALAELAAMANEHRGEAIAEVVSAAPLDAAAREALVARLAEITHKKITLQERVDESLLGGLRVQVGSLLLDGSVKRRLAGMREELMRVALPESTNH